MKQEQKLVAELYRYLAPFIDTEQKVYISLDGQAARTAVGKGTFSDGTIPDLWFTLLGKETATLVEAKTVNAKDKSLLMQTQIRAWRHKGTGAHVPQYWVATNRDFDNFYFWKHEDFLPILNRTKAKGNADLSMPTCRMEFRSIAALALHVLRAA
jgi:hypothetical protein